MSKYDHVIHKLLTSAWAIHPHALSVIVDIVRFRALGNTLTEAEIQQRLAEAAAVNGPRRGGQRSGKVAIIPVYGTIAPRQNLMTQTSGGTSLDLLAGAFREVMADPEIGAVILEFDTPGGMADGVEEFAAEIRAARGTKPIVSVVNHMAASAGYYLASQADEIVSSPSGQVGSIGVVYPHEDWSAAMENEGIKTTLITAGKYKAEGNRFEPLSDEAREEIQRHVDTYYDMFIRSVARGRGVSVDKVRSDYGEGRMLMPKAALNVGMIDRVDTLDNTARRLARGGVSLRPVSTEPDISNLPIGEASLPAGETFAEQFDRVLVELNAFAIRAGNLRELRASEGRSLSAEKIDDLESMAARLSEVRDSVLALVPREEIETAAPPRKNVLIDIFDAAYERGLRIN